jgi:uncharacterized protein (DUF2252 family)
MDRRLEGAMRDPIEEFLAFNRPFANRSAELIKYKIARMAESPFAFFRGAFHLFARDVLDRSMMPLPLFGGGAEVDLVGDIHGENYGSYKAADGAVHYDVNDFDETTRGRFDFDVCRFAVSTFLAGRERNDPLEQTVQATLSGVRAYADAVRDCVKKGKDIDLDVSESRPCESAAVNDHVRAFAAAKRSQFIGKLTQVKDGKRQLVRSSHYFNVGDDEKSLARRLLADYRARLPQEVGAGYEDYYRVEDVCGRVAGIGSMGRLRYVLLVSGKGSAEGRNVLLEFKEARPSAYDTCRGRETGAEAAAGRAERVVAAQRASQAATSQHLGYAVDGGASFQGREIGPHDGRVDFKALKTPQLFEGVVRVQAAILARTHGRAAARAVGPANPLAEVADADVFCQRVLSFALGYADLVRSDWTRFVGARGRLDNVAAWAG